MEMTIDEHRKELSRIIQQKSLRVGDFTLASGKKSSYYLDCRMTTLDPRGSFLIATLILASIREHKIDANAIGGLTMGADPIVAAVAVVSGIQGTPLPAFIVRKEAKGHGTQQSIEGYAGEPGSRVIVVDDVCTSGGSILQAAEKSEQAGYKVAAAFCVVDREEGGTELIARKYPFHALFTAKELLKNS